MSVAVQGYGNAGYFAAEFLHDLGCKIVAVSDSVGGIYNADGLDPKAVLKHKTDTRSVVGFRGSDRITNEELLAVKCDILAPAALENVLTIDNAAKVKAKVVLELANGPTTFGADEILWDKGVIVAPDILANAGGVTVSYFEWLQGLVPMPWSERETNLKLRDIMQYAAVHVCERAKDQNIPLRTAALSVAIERVAQATAARGIYP
jgi:glutamate dehydrogenase (NAD(P)+)